MKSELQITFRNMKPSAEVEGWIQAEVAKLETFYDRLTGCHVAVEIPHRHHLRGKQYHVRIDLFVPKGEIVVKRDANLNAQARHTGEPITRKSAEIKLQHKDLRQTINDAFKATGRRLQDYARHQRRDLLKSRASLPKTLASMAFSKGG